MPVPMFSSFSLDCTLNTDTRKLILLRSDLLQPNLPEP